MSIHIRRAKPSDAALIAGLVGELLHEIMAAIGTKMFGFSQVDTTARTMSWLADGTYIVLLAREGGDDSGPSRLV